jgi:hypothetical protein
LEVRVSARPAGEPGPQGEKGEPGIAGTDGEPGAQGEKGEPGLALGQILRYLDAIAPGSTLLDLLAETDPALLTLEAREKTQRVRDMTAAELDELQF